MRIGCVVMAAGNGTRFGENKLLVNYRGKPLIRYALEAVPVDKLTHVVVVTQYDAVAELAQEFGFAVIRNDSPELGISHTIVLGTQALAENCDGILYQVADQPLLRQQTVRRLLAAFRTEPGRIVAPFDGNRRGNPCVFPSAFFPQLRSLSGDRGGSQIIRKHPECVLPVSVSPEELFDVDTVQSLHDLPSC